MEDIITSKEIIGLVDDAKQYKKAKDLVYKQIFPCEYVPETVETGKTFICFDVDIQKASNKTYLSPVLYIWVFTHRSKLRLPEGGVRTDEICCQIAKKINGSKFYGLGELELYSVKRFAPMTDFQGKVMTFHMKEFNRLHDPHKPIPINRRGT